MSDTIDNKPDSNSPPYRAMMEEVEGIIASISSQEVDLDQMVQQVEKGYKLIAAMRQRLATTKMKVDELREGFEQRNG